jgi:endoglucanase
MPHITRSRTTALLLTVASLGLVAIAVLTFVASRSDSNPFAGRTLYVNPDSSAALAATVATGSDRVAFDALASVPSAIWLLPEVHPTEEVGALVAQTEAAAARDDALPVFVIYGIPSRDCGNFSAGGSNEAEYGNWISAIAGALTRPTILILEPDALALAPDCGTQEATTALLRDAVDRFDGSPATIYLDGGHSNWRPVPEMARLLADAGVERVRGFATNVSNYNLLADEIDYGAALSEALGGAHFVVDTSRNGSATGGQWCNPRGPTIGATPSGVVGGGPHDANLWIKNPGESDGECNGGPPAGVWWPDQARELVRGVD